MTIRLLIVGAGYSGKAIARRAHGEAAWIGGTTRSEDKFGALAEAGAQPFLFDGKQISQPLAAAMVETTHLIQSIAPGEEGDPLLDILGHDLKQAFPALRWVGYLSTVGVYGDHGGAWVDETTECRPVSGRSVMRLMAEDQWIAAGQAAGIPVAVLRLSGIYGPGRNAFVNYQNGKARRLIKPGQVFNRIHVDDISCAAFFLLAMERNGLWNVTDSEPASPQDVVACAAKLMAVEPPPEVDFAAAQLTPMARSFYGENKRVANGKLKDAGYAFSFPDFRSGLSHLWKDDRWRG